MDLGSESYIYQIEDVTRIRHCMIFNQHDNDGKDFLVNESDGLAW